MHALLPVDGAGVAARSVRRPAHAGTSYPIEAHALRTHLDAFFADVPPAPRGAPLAGLVAPHIDLRIGGQAYGHAYAAIQATPAARYVILGTAHMPGRGRFAATGDDYATPLGVATTDRAFLDRLAARVPIDLFRDRYLHVHEHAIEFQVVLLQHVLSRPDVTVVPILVSSIQDLLVRGATPADDPEIAAVVAGLRTTLDDDVPTVVIASVDFGHVGTRYGDREGATPSLVGATLAKDRRLIAALEAGDPTAFWHALAADGDRTRVCGAAPLVVFLELMRGRRGRLLCHDRFDDRRTRSCVSYASLAFPDA